MPRPLCRLGGLGLIAALGLACDSEGVNADFTGISLYTQFPEAWAVTELRTTGLLDDDNPAFNMGITPVSDDPAVDGVKTELLAIIMEANKAGQRVRVRVEGRDAAGEILGAAEDVLRLNLGFFVTSTVTLTADVLCGNGLLDEAEACDDANRRPDDGCSPTCEVEADYVCAQAPSQCSLASVTAIVDASSAACPGNGTTQTPFCVASRALEAPWATTVIIRSGRYDEELQITKAVRVLAEPGAELESTRSPVLEVLSDDVHLSGLTVRGISRLGGGMRIAADGDVSLDGLQVGPSSTVGLSIEGSALVRLENSRIINNAAGGLRLSSTRGYIVQNSFITGNGDSQSDFGGVHMLSAPSNSLFANNTIADNEAAQPARGGVVCAEPGEVLNSIVWDNGTITSSAASACEHRYSDVGPLAAGVVLADTNFSEDPAFAAGYRLSAASPCLDRGDPQSIMESRAPDTDFEGQARPQGPNIDVGADEAG